MKQTLFISVSESRLVKDDRHYCLFHFLRAGWGKDKNRHYHMPVSKGRLGKQQRKKKDRHYCLFQD